MSAGSGGAAIFGNSGGVMRAALRSVYHSLTGSNPSANLLDLKEVQGLSGLREAQVSIGETVIDVAVCHEMRNADELLRQVKNGTCRYDFIEVMACRGGCIGGAGQPAGTVKIEKRMNSLNLADNRSAMRFCHENPEIISLYKEFIGLPGGAKAKNHLHTTYTDRSDLL
jgi:iron only hydrogenase large subunit-like protein